MVKKVAEILSLLFGLASWIARTFSDRIDFATDETIKEGNFIWK